MELGRLRGVKAEDYHGHKALGSTAIRIAAKKSVAHYLLERDKGPTAAMRLGSLTHCAVLEPGRFETDFIVPEARQCSGVEVECGRSVPAGAEHCRSHGGQKEAERWEIAFKSEKSDDGFTASQIRDLLKEQKSIMSGGRCPVKEHRTCKNMAVPGADHCGIHGGHLEAEVWRDHIGPVEVISQADRDKALTAAAGVRFGLHRLGYGRILDLASGSETEVSYRGIAILTDSADGERGFRVSVDQTDLALCEAGGPGLLVQGRVDLELPLKGEYAICDLKGTQLRHLRSPESWSWHVVREGLHIQAALYRELCCAAHGKPPIKWSWIAYESEPPHALCVFDAAPDLLDLGHREAAEGIRRWVEYLNNGDMFSGWTSKRAECFSPIKE